MSMQQHLFDPPEQGWVKKIWSSMNQENRREIVSMLAEIGRTALEPRPPIPEKEAKDEYRPHHC